MREAGLVGRTIPGEQLLYKVFNAVGETLPSMAIARQAVSLAKGRSSATVQEAARHVAPRLVELLQPLANDLFDEHRRAGRALVLATTTPHDLVRPFAELLGLDDVVATRYEVDVEGRYTGALDGPFVWSAGKLSAIRTWATSRGVDLSTSYAYSDSVFDTPMLSAVGHPVVVNPDPRMRLMAAARQWPVVSLSAPNGSLPRVPVLNVEFQRLAMTLVHPTLFPYASFDIEGVEHIPADGPVILVGNHRSYFDPIAIAVTIARTGRGVRFLGKKEVFDAPVVGQIATALGGIRVDRGTGSDAPLEAAVAALEAGDMVALMPQGTIPRGRAFYEPELKGRWGAARLAALTKATVVPIGLWGTEHVWPRSAKLPNMLNLTDPPRVTVRVGEPVRLVHRSPDADTRRIMKAIMDLLPPESRVRREPTADEIRRAMPSSAKGDGSAEATRRPGSD